MKNSAAPPTNSVTASMDVSHVRHRSAYDGKSTYFGKYITLEGSKNLLSYKYKGNDHSLIYKHLLTRMNNYLIEFVPLWVAPNVITLVGLILVLISHLVFAYYCPLLEGIAPSWTYILAAICLFLYQTLDNLDGKQARRTGSSSPLGLLFDHGCDALNVTVGCCTMASIAQLGTGWKSLLFFVSGNFAFTFATWEEYYTGALNLPIINGPTEGVLVGVFLKFFTAIVGGDFWKQEYFPGIQNNNALILLSTSSCLFTLATHVFNVYQAVKLRNDNFLVAITRLVPFALLNASAIVWIAISPTGIFSLHPRMMLWTLGLLNSKLVLHLMLAHLCGEEYHPFRKTLVPLFYVAAHTAYSWFLGIYTAIDETLILSEFFYISLASFVHITGSAVLEVRNILGVDIFSIPSEPLKKNR